jgi:acylphosphatase
MQDADSRVAIAVRISGIVQGVGYRYFAQATATTDGLVGWVRNLPDGDVECEAEGRQDILEKWIEQLKKGPPLARVDKIQVDWKTAIGGFSGFRIR